MKKIDKDYESMNNFSELSKTEMRKVIKFYNLHTKIVGYSKMDQRQLSLELEKHLHIQNGVVHIKPPSKDTMRFQNKPQQMTAFDFFTNVIKKFIRQELTKTNVKQVSDVLKSIHVFSDDEVRDLIGMNMSKMPKSKATRIDDYDGLLKKLREMVLESMQSAKETLSKDEFSRYQKISKYF